MPSESPGDRRCEPPVSSPGADLRIGEAAHSARADLEALSAQSHEPRARGDAELDEDAAEMVVDGAAAEEELGGHLTVGGALGDEAGDLKPLRREPIQRARRARSRRLPARTQLDPRLLRPRPGAELLESLERQAQGRPRGGGW